MMRQKAYSIINISGLSIGIAATLVILIYIADELSYDKFHQGAERIYRIGFRGRLQGNEFTTAVSPAPLGATMQREIADVAEVVRFGLWRTMPMNFGDKSFTEKHFLVADSNFFKFFSFPVVAGNPDNFLKGPDKLVITESAAKKYFGNENPIGKIMLRGSDRRASEITGVVKDPPHNSHIQFNMVLSAESWNYLRSNDEWTSSNIYTYVKLHPNGSLTNLKKDLDRMMEIYFGPELEKLIGTSLVQFRAQGDDAGFITQPFLDIHLHSNIDEEITPNGNMQYLYIFGIISVFIIAIACINFMNLSTARSANRAKEVGVRKTIGAIRERLFFQFLSESLIYSIISMLLALFIIALTLDSFNLLSGKDLSFSIFAHPAVITALAVFTIVVGLLAGSYPAFYLTAFKPSEVLKGKIRAGFKNSALRNTLVVCQFVISIALIFGSLVVYRQLTYLQEKNLGFDKENVIELLHTLALDQNARPFKNEIQANPMFKGGSFADNLPPKITWNSAFRKAGSEQDFLLSINVVDHDHVEVMGYKMIEGRFFSEDFRSDTAAAILNETAFRQMGFKNLDEAVLISYRSDPPRPLKVIGVIKDFNFSSLRESVRPLVMLPAHEPALAMAIRLAPGNSQDQLKTLEGIWKKYAGSAPFEYSFLDQNFDALFRAEQRMGQIILIFTVLAIAIACLGLFGLAAYTAEQRAKEISIRKVLGASIPQIMILMSRDFTILVLVAFAIASPLAWYMANQWLSGFANRITIDIWVMVISGMVAFVIALLTISSQSIRAARENPVKAMRSE